MSDKINSANFYAREDRETKTHKVDSTNVFKVEGLLRSKLYKIAYDPKFPQQSLRFVSVDENQAQRAEAANKVIHLNKNDMLQYENFENEVNVEALALNGKYHWHMLSRTMKYQK